MNKNGLGFKIAAFITGSTISLLFVYMAFMSLLVPDTILEARDVAQRMLYSFFIVYQKSPNAFRGPTLDLTHTEYLVFIWTSKNYEVDSCEYQAWVAPSILKSHQHQFRGKFELLPDTPKGAGTRSAADSLIPIDTSFVPLKSWWE